MGHNAWTNYVVGSRWNIIFDIKPEKGHRFLMDGLPGVIAPGSECVGVEVNHIRSPLVQELSKARRVCPGRPTVHVRPLAGQMWRESDQPLGPRGGRGGRTAVRAGASARVRLVPGPKI